MEGGGGCLLGLLEELLLLGVILRRRLGGLLGGLLAGLLRGYIRTSSSGGEGMSPCGPSAGLSSWGWPLP